MIHAHPALRKSPKWLVTPGVFVLLAVLLSGIPTARAPYEDIAPTTQVVTDGWANGTFPDNISASDDTYILLQSENQSYETTPGSGYWFWNATVYYNWTAVNTTGDRWHLSIECRFVGPESPYTLQNGYPIFISVLTPPSSWNVRLFCPPAAESATEDTYAACFCDDPLFGTEGYNLTTAELANGTPSIVVLGQWLDGLGVPGESNEYTWWLDHVILRRVYNVTVPPPSSPLLDWMLILILLILWVSFSAIGAAKPSGLLFMGGALCGIILAFFFVLPVAELPGIAVLGLAMTCMLGGAGIAISSGGEAG